MNSLYLIASHPEVQDTLYDEIHRVCGDNVPRFTDLPDLVYMLCLIYETLRLFPVVGSLPHLVQTEQILLEKHQIPQGTVISVDFVNIQRNEKLWGEDSNEFDPSRWLEGNERKMIIPARGAFIGFSDGPRACLGSYRSRFEN
jgi:cytochrome P450 family 709